MADSVTEAWTNPCHVEARPRRARLGHRHGLEGPAVHALAGRRDASAIPSSSDEVTPTPGGRVGLALHHGSRPAQGPAPRSGFTRFHECNVRTHKGNGVPGVWFFSLDAANPVAVWTARSSEAQLHLRPLPGPYGQRPLDLRGPTTRGARSRMQWRVGEPLLRRNRAAWNTSSPNATACTPSRGRVGVAWSGTNPDPVPGRGADPGRRTGPAAAPRSRAPACHAAHPLHVHGWPIKRIR